MLASLALAIARRLDEETLRRLVDKVFVRTSRQLERSIADPRAAQEERLQRILVENRDTEVGKKLGFEKVRTLADWQKAAPVVTWDDVAPLVDRTVAGERGVLVSEDPFFFATTSGTTGRRKLIPVTSSFVEECRAANKLLYRATLREIPALLKGKRLSMRSPKVEDLGHGKRAGSITVALGGFEDEDGVLDAVPADVFMVDDFAARYFLALRFALAARTTVCAAVNPSTLALYQQTLETHAPELARALRDGTLGVDDATIVGDTGDAGRARVERLKRRVVRDEEAAKRVDASAAQHGRARMRDVLPHLRGLVCWKGGSAPWYLEKLRETYGDLPVLDYGYCASEGCFAAPISTATAESVLVPHGHVVELAPLEQLDDVRAGKAQTVSLDEARIGHSYVPIVTTSAGLYRYDMNDVVEVTGKLGDPLRGAPLVVFRHKAGAMASITGEKVGESHVVAAAARARVGAAGFCAGPVLPVEGAPFWVVAVDTPPAGCDLEALGRAFDDALRKENLEYDAKRASLRLASARAVALPDGAIARFREARVKAGAPDAHVKVPHVSPDGALLLSLGLEASAPEVAARVPRKVSAT